MSQPIICLMGPTASGKTTLALELVERLPCEIISVDSAMVYKYMNIGTAKPSAEMLKVAPHHLIDLVDPKEIYSAGQFRLDVLQVINECIARDKIPLLVGGSMLYFRVLMSGLAHLPKADKTVRETLAREAQKIGWEGMHRNLASFDPEAASKMMSKDSQRIQRALEVYLLSGKTITAWQKENTHPLQGYTVHQLVLFPNDRARLHQLICLRLKHMLQLGFIDEVKALYERGDLNSDLPSMRSVGYRQIWEYLSGLTHADEMQEKILAATRQLAKRQMTWLRSWPDTKVFEAEDQKIVQKVLGLISSIIK